MFLFVIVLGVSGLAVAALEHKALSNERLRRAEAEASLARDRAHEAMKAASRAAREMNRLLQDLRAGLEREAELKNRLEREYRQVGHDLQDVKAGLARGAELRDRAEREYRQAGHDLQASLARQARQDLEKEQAKDLTLAKTRPQSLGRGRGLGLGL